MWRVRRVDMVRRLGRLSGLIWLVMLGRLMRFEESWRVKKVVSVRRVNEYCEG